MAKSPTTKSGIPKAMPTPPGKKNGSGKKRKCKK
jgi:hypothetical protein